MLRGIALVALLAGCRQILGLDPAQVTPADAMADAIPDNPDRSERMKVISIVGDSPLASFEEFPLWISITDPQIAARARTDGSDIYFQFPDGDHIAHEIQHWDPTSGRLDAWVQARKSAPFELHYGEPALPVPRSRGGVFTPLGGFAAVWHLDDTLPATSLVDATGVTTSTMAGLGAIDRQAARLGAGIHFTDIAQRVLFNNPLLGNTSHTISAWVKLDAPVSYDPIIVVGTPSPNDSRWIHARYAASSVGYGMYGNDDNSGVIIPEGAWTALHWVYDAPSRTSRLYLNGMIARTHLHDAGISTSGAMGYLGYAPVQWGPNLDTETGMNGTLDEVRIQTVARSDTWVLTDWATQTFPENFYSVGMEQLP